MHTQDGGFEHEAGSREDHHGLSENDSDYFNSYGDAAVHRTMLSDRIRTDAFRRALESSVRPGDVVLDVGAGSGILSLFAARAGARRVHAVEASPIGAVLERIVAANDPEHVVRVHRGRIEDLDFDEYVDVLVSEWLGYFALGECMFESVLEARDAYLTRGGDMIPQRVELFLAPVEDGILALSHGIALWSRPVWGFDFGPMLEHELNDLCSTTPGVFPETLLGPAVCLVDIDCRTAMVPDFWFDVAVELKIERSGTLHGFAGWFDAWLTSEVLLSTAPDAPETHWRQAWFPIRPFEVLAGDVVKLRMRAVRRFEGDDRLPVYFGDGALVRDGVSQRSFFHRWFASLE